MTEMNQHLDVETLSAYGDGDLNALAAARADRHLEACAGCRGTLERLRGLMTAARDLPRNVAPPARVWTDLRLRLGRERQGAATRARWWHNGWLATAAALVLVAGTAVLTTTVAPNAKAGKPVGVAAVPPVSTVVLAVDGNYSPTVLELRRTLESQRSTLAPQTLHVLESSLAIINAAIDEARAALAADPANVALVDVLAARYERKVDLLQRATRLSPSL